MPPNAAPLRIVSLRLLIILALLGASDRIHGKPKAPGPVIFIKTDRPEALYKCGETATFTITVTEDAGPVTEGEVVAVVTFDGGRKIQQKTLQLGAGPAAVSETLQQPGFLRCAAVFRKDGKSFHGLGGAGFEPERIEPTAVMPDDFDAFWDQGRKRLAAIPLDLRMKKLDKASDDRQDSFAISLANIDDTRVYGFLSVPKGREPPFPAYVTVPGAGPGPHSPGGRGLAAKGALGLCVGVHAYDVGALTKEEIAAAYKELNKEQRYPYQGAPDREKYYFRRAILGVDRAVNWLASRPDWDRKHMVVRGSSQGGGFALIMAGLNRHITAAAANVPALCDHAGAKAERSPGWPRMVRGAGADREQCLAMSAYFDAVNFARKITCPTIVSVGFIDATCCPSSVYSAYNQIRSPKRLFTDPLKGHCCAIGEYPKFAARWVDAQLGLRDPIPPTAAEE